jgi:hypothetical protein
MIYMSVVICYVSEDVQPSKNLDKDRLKADIHLSAQRTKSIFYFR